MTASFGAPAPTSNETGALRQINSEQQTFVNKDFVKNISWLNQSVDVLSAYTQKLQAGVDSANSNVIDQIQGVIADLMTVIAGGEPVGINLGDLRYVFQAIGAMLGINPDTPFPLNLFEAAGHWFDNFIAPLDQLSDMIWNSISAWAEDLGFSEAAVDSMQEFNDAVINWYNGLDEAFGIIGDVLKDFFKLLGLGSGGMNLGPLQGFWDSIVQHIQDLLEGPEQTILSVLSSLLVVIFKALTWIVNATNPMNLFDSTGIRFVGPQLAPVVSGATTDWSVGSNLATSWVYDATTNRDGSDGAFKTSGNSTTKRVLSQVIQQCTPGKSYYLSGWLKWSSVPTNVDTFGLCVVFYSGATEISETNVNVATGHGATGGWQQVSQVIVVPQNVDGFKLGARVSNSVTSGNVWANGLSYTMEEPLAQGILNGILDFPQHVIDSVIGGLQNTVDWAVTTIHNILNFFFGSDTFLGHILAGVIPALDASIIATGQFAQNLVAGLVDFIHDVLNFFFGEDTFLGHVLASIIPSLDASKITTGAFTQAQVTNLTSDLGSKLAATVFTTKLNAGNNIATNPSFENTSLYLGPSSAITYSNEQSRFLFKSAKIVADHTNPLKAYFVTSDSGPIYVNCVQGQVFYMEAYVRGKSSNVQTSGGANGISLVLGCTDTAGTETQWVTQSFTASTALNGAWSKLSGYFLIPSGAYSFTPYVQVGSNVTSGDAYYFDSAVCREVTDANTINQALYAANSPGSSVLTSVIPALDASKVTTGAFSQAMVTNLTSDLGSKLAANIFVTKLNAGNNIATNPSFENTSLYLGNTSDSTYSNEQSRFLFRSAKIIANHTNYLYAYFVTNETGPIYVNCVPGQVFYMECYVRGKSTNTQSSGGSGGITLSIACTDTAGTVNNWVNATSVTASTAMNGVWTKISGYVVIPSGAYSFTPYAQLTPNVNNGEAYYFESAVCREVTDANQISQALYASDTATATVLSSAVPSLDASKITTGTIGTGIIPNLDASKVTTGTLGTSRIPDITRTMSTDLQATIDNVHQAVNGGSTTGNIVTTIKTNLQTLFSNLFGQTSVATVLTGGAIPSLDSSKITTGTLATGRIPSLDSSQITTGTFGSSRIANLAITNAHINDLSGSKVNAGTVGATYIPSLDASKVTTGTFGTGLIPNVTKAMSADLQGTIDNIYQAVYGGATTGNTVASVKTGLLVFPGANIASAVSASVVPSLDGSKITTGSVAAARIAGLPASQITSGTFSGTYIAANAITNTHVNDVSGSKINAGTVGATYVAALDASKITTGTFADAMLAALSATKLTGTIDAANRIAAGAISNTHLAATGLDAGKLTVGTLNAANRIAAGAIVNGHLASGAVTTVKIGDSQVTGAKTAGLDASKITSGQLNSAQLPTNVGAVGSGVLLQRTGSAGTFTTYYDGNGIKLPWGFYNSTGTLVTSDMTVSNVGGFICATASNAGWYLIDINYQLKGASDLYDFTYMWGLTPVIYKSSGTTIPTVPYKWGATGVCIRDTNLTASNSWSADFCGGNFIVYLAANETIYPGYFWSREGSTSSAEIIIATSAAGAYGTYFAMSLLNRSLV